MKKDQLEIKTAIQIGKPVSEVFEAIVNPAKMAEYFISIGTARLEEGKTVMWRFPEFDMDFPVKGGKIIQNKHISFYWDVDNNEMLVEIILIPGKADNTTVVTVTEKGMNNDDAGIKWLKGNTEGWANFLACLKAYLEYGINLRKGAFDFLSEKTT